MEEEFVKRINAVVICGGSAYNQHDFMILFVKGLCKILRKHFRAFRKNNPKATYLQFLCFEKQSLYEVVDSRYWTSPMATRQTTRVVNTAGAQGCVKAILSFIFGTRNGTPEDECSMREDVPHIAFNGRQYEPNMSYNTEMASQKVFLISSKSFFRTQKMMHGTRSLDSVIPIEYQTLLEDRTYGDEKRREI